MAKKVSLDAYDLSVEVTSTDGLSVDSDVVSELIKAARQLNMVIPMLKVRLDRVGETNVFNYDLTAQDGREWHQNIIVDSEDAPMNFDIEDHWRVSEFIGHRPLRDLVVRMAFSHSVEKIKVDWK